MYVHTCRVENKFGGRGANLRLSNIEEDKTSTETSYNDFIINFEDNSERAKPFSFLSPLAPLENPCTLCTYICMYESFSNRAAPHYIFALHI